jgi:uncharacterized HAD superfamily protein
VVGVPRSGMISAYVISSFLNLDCTDIDSFIANKNLQRGITRSSRYSLILPHDARRVLIVDDSINSGKSMKEVIERIPDFLSERIYTLAIYSSDKRPTYINGYFKLLVGRKIFEWSIFHSNLIPLMCFDLDGVLCKDPTIDQDDDGKMYLDFLRNAIPLFLPTGKVEAIVTNRLEKYRKVAEEWLNLHHIEYVNLVMLNSSSANERSKIDPSIDNKARYYKSSNSILFVESDPLQSVKIAEFSGKPVYCVNANCLVNPSGFSKVIHNPHNIWGVRYYYWKHRLKHFLLNFFDKRGVF